MTAILNWNLQLRETKNTLIKLVSAGMISMQSDE